MHLVHLFWCILERRGESVGRIITYFLHQLLTVSDEVVDQTIFCRMLNSFGDFK